MESSSINYSHPQQDAHKARTHNADLPRYRMAEAILPPSIAGLSVLELGGGIAELSRRFQARGARMTFLDVSSHNVERAKSMGFDAFEADLNLGLPSLPDQQFDGVVILEVLEHIVQSEQLLSEIHRVLKPNGFLILSVPNFAFLLNRLRILSGGLSHDEGYHYRFFTLKSLVQGLRKAGFTVEQHSHSAPAIGANIFWNRLLGKARLHLKIPRPLASMGAQTLMVRAMRLP